VASLLGLTDYFDGRLARRQGVTRLGALLDPIADKIFIAVFYLFLAHFHYLPLWLVLLILAREFFITALRQMVPGNLPVSWLAKLKTSVQMLAAGLIVVAQVFPAWRGLGLAVAALCLVVGVWLTRFRLWQKLTVTSLAGGLPFLSFLPPSSLPLILGLMVLAFTWLSAADYLKRAWPRLFCRKGLLRLFEALALPLTAISLMPLTSRFWLVVPLLLIVEFARQALGLISQKEDFREGLLLGSLSLALLALWAVNPASSWLVTSLVVILLIDLTLTVKKAFRLRQYLQG
jgi:CDP-diacylglycerol--glycerol-3-phosphate 3-phosphatidyltransferase